MKITITEIFCEIITGIFTCLTVLPLFILFSVFTLDEAWKWACANIQIATVAGILLGLYVMGIVVDACGMLFDEFFGSKITSKDHLSPTANQIKAFWQKVPAHVLAYRDYVWTYYFCYRNVVFLIPFALILWLIQLLSSGKTMIGIIVGLSLIALEYVLLRTIRVLLELYEDITKSFD